MGINYKLHCGNCFPFEISFDNVKAFNSQHVLHFIHKSHLYLSNKTESKKISIYYIHSINY